MGTSSMRLMLALVFAAALLEPLRAREEPASASSDALDTSNVEDMKMQFSLGRRKLEGHVAYQKTKGKKPVVVILPDEDGLGDFEISIARRLATLGYVGFAVDLDGSLEKRPRRWIRRSRAALKAVPTIGDIANADLIAILGFSQGGTGALELARTGSKVAGIASIHPSSLESIGTRSAKGGFDGRLALFVGDLQSGFDSSNVFEFQAEMKNLSITYEVTRLSKATDDFVIPTGGSSSPSSAEGKLASSRVWDSLTGFLDDVFNPQKVEYLDEPWNSTLVDDQKLETSYVSYMDGGTDLRGFVAYDKKVQGRRPVVIVFPDWDGVDEYEMWRAKLLAMMGYVGFVADMFGADVEQGSSLPIEKRIELTSSLLGGKRRAGRKRMLAALKALKEDESLAEIVDVDNMVAIGYCFGGTAVIELQRVEPKGLKGVVSFHGGNLDSGGAKSGKCNGVAALIHNGDDDASVLDEEIDGVRAELNKAQANWEFVDYGATVHSFTHPALPRNGTRAAYDPLADTRSWHSMQSFFKRIFSGDDQYVACPSR